MRSDDERRPCDLYRCPYRDREQLGIESRCSAYAPWEQAVSVGQSTVREGRVAREICDARSVTINACLYVLTAVGQVVERDDTANQRANKADELAMIIDADAIPDPRTVAAVCALAGDSWWPYHATH